MAGQQTYDVVIAGGGVIGSSIAYFLTAGSGLSVAVIEPDPTYRTSATPRSAGGLRVQFSSKLNIAMSRYGAEFMRNAPDLLEVDGTKPFIDFRERGYLILSDASSVDAHCKQHAVQQRSGAPVSLLQPDDLQRKFPWLSLDGICMGSFGERDEGWLDPYALLQAFRQKSIAQGATYVTDSVAGFEKRSGLINRVNLVSGESISCQTVVNAAGTRGRQVAAMASIDDLPVSSRKRQVFVFDCREHLANFPLIIGPDGLYVRPEGHHYICGRAPASSNDPETLSLEVDHTQFERELWPRLARMVPAFEAIKMTGAWAGHYDVNTFDHNAILGRHPGTPNFVFANGFSGHGLQQSPAVGRGIAELISEGHYTSLDLSDFGFNRLAKRKSAVEQNVF